MTESTTLAELNVNSAQMIDIVLNLEDELGVNIGDSAAENLYTVGEIVSTIDTLLNPSKKSAD
ncbi:MAG TPA: phosphopantetheine-binding protein [Candidatus Eisenbacteria bacterium]|nr:phosphopantetheine-binding protein [Candidatus Eisenbacteria bacterium]